MVQRAAASRAKRVGLCSKMGPVGNLGRENIVGNIHIRGKGVERPTGQPGK